MELHTHQAEMHVDADNNLPYKCDECGTKFALERQLNRHVVSHSEELKPFKCKDCKSRFRLQEHLDMHAKKHDKDRPFVCEQCNYRYESKTHLMSHMKSHTNDRPYSCDICHSTFKRSYDMKVHRSTHTELKPFHCDECGSDFKKLAYLTKHKRTHTKDRFSCEQCGATFKEKRALIGHVRLHERDKSKCYPCSICGESFPTTKLLQIHFRTHPKPEIKLPRRSPQTEENKHHCYQCRCSFSTSNAYMLHKQLQHEGETPYQCQFCEACFSQEMYRSVHSLKHLHKKIFCDRCKIYCYNEYDFGIHEWQHVIDKRVAVAALEDRADKTDGDNESNVLDEQLGLFFFEDESNTLKSCSVSQQSTSQLISLPSTPQKESVANSVTVVESVQSKRYNCEDCGCLFNLEKPYLLHKQLQHEGKTPFECHWCTAAFTKERFLTVHICKHLEKRSICSRCKICCNSEYELGIHDCVEEVEQLQFHCTNCGVSFSTAYPYQLHMKLQHTGISPFLCQLCKASFTEEKYLNVHHCKHQSKEITCVRCSTVCNSEYEMGLHEWHHVVLEHQNTTVQPTKALTTSSIETPNEKEKPPVSVMKAQTVFQQTLTTSDNQELSITLVCTDNKSPKASESFTGVQTPSCSLLPPVTAMPSLQDKALPNTMENLLQNYKEEMDKANRRKKFHCDNCGCSFGFIKPYNLHLALQHKEESSFQCSLCPASFTKEMFLNVHLYKHMRKEMMCPYCPKLCSSEYEFSLHEWEHELDSRVTGVELPTVSTKKTIFKNSDLEITRIPATSSQWYYANRKKKVLKKAQKNMNTFLLSREPRRRGRPPKVRIPVNEVLIPETEMITPNMETLAGTESDTPAMENQQTETNVVVKRRRGRPPKAKIPQDETIIADNETIIPDQEIFTPNEGTHESIAVANLASIGHEDEISEPPKTVAVKKRRGRPPKPKIQSKESIMFQEDIEENTPSTIKNESSNFINTEMDASAEQITSEALHDATVKSDIARISYSRTPRKRGRRRRRGRYRRTIPRPIIIQHPSVNHLVSEDGEAINNIVGMEGYSYGGSISLTSCHVVDAVAVNDSSTTETVNMKELEVNNSATMEDGPVNNTVTGTMDGVSNDINSMEGESIPPQPKRKRGRPKKTAHLGSTPVSVRRSSRTSNPTVESKLLPVDDATALTEESQTLLQLERPCDGNSVSTLRNYRSHKRKNEQLPIAPSKRIPSPKPIADTLSYSIFNQERSAHELEERRERDSYSESQIYKPCFVKLDRIPKIKVEPESHSKDMPIDGDFGASDDNDNSTAYNDSDFTSNHAACNASNNVGFYGTCSPGNTGTSVSGTDYFGKNHEELSQIKTEIVDDHVDETIQTSGTGNSRGNPEDYILPFF